MLTKLCPGCGSVIPQSIPRCPSCAAKLPVQTSERHRRYDQTKRNKQADRFYHSPEWRQMRLRKLSSVNFRCETCWREYLDGFRDLANVQPATEVHHIVELSEDWSRRLDFGNLKADCAAHHNAERQTRFPRGAVEKV